MKKLKIALSQGNYNGTSYELILRACEDPAMLELCTPVVIGNATAALAYRKALELTTNFVTVKHPDEAPDGRLSIVNATEDIAQVEMGSDTANALQQEEESMQAAMAYLADGAVDALVLSPALQHVPCPDSATEIVITDKAIIMPLSCEPDIEDIVNMAAILERDFDRRSPRIAIIQESRMQNMTLAAQATAESGINTYGPYTAEQFLDKSLASHFDGIIIADGADTAQRMITELAQEAPARFFAGTDNVVTGAFYPANMDDAGRCVAPLTTLTLPIYTAIDIIRNRAGYDEARRNPLPKLFRDKREDRRTGDAPRPAEKNDQTEKAS